MIVTQIDAGWQLIHQQAHGLLAVPLALHWKPEKQPVHWVETLIALTEHDDGQNPWEGRNHLTTVGAPLHFQLRDYSLEQCKNMIDIGLRKSRWNALMMSMHTSFLYEPKRGSDKALDLFLDQQVQNQTKWRRQTKTTKSQTRYAYAFVQWCDALSLILCLDQVPPEGRRLEVSIGPDGVSYYIHQKPGGALGLDPWPFDEPRIKVHVETGQVTQLTFKTDEELYRALQDAVISEKEWTLERA